MELHRVYRPLSANAFRCDDGYAEVPPAAALAPYVHCFWGTRGAECGHTGGERVIPDTCMDLIFQIRYSRNRVESRFCALDDAAYVTPAAGGREICATFGIRFYAWSAVCFAEESLCDSMHVVCNPHRYFHRICAELESRLFDTSSLAERILLAEGVLLRALQPERQRPEVLNALYVMATGRGALRAEDVAGAACVSVRQLQRLFREQTGAPPKLLAQLIRCQRIYRELAEQRFAPMEAVGRYGYADQSHLIRDFRRFHGLTPTETVRMMRS